MRNLFFIAFLVISCSQLKTEKNYARSVASQTSNIKFELKLSQDLVFANGANYVHLYIKLVDDQGLVVSPPAHEIKVNVSQSAKVSKPLAENQGFMVKITPLVKSKPIKVLVQWQENKSQHLTLKTTLAPLKDKMLPLKSNFNQSTYVNNENYSRQENYPEGQFESFSFNNTGKNKIVTADESERHFSFEYQEQARQNLSLMVTDSPNGFTSHMMLSYFMFFPRTYLPYIEQINSEKIVTLPTGETIGFNQDNEIVSGVFTEGPVDIGPDRFKRKYADLKYLGKGIILRANARGQMPQTGQFENTSIDMDYGIKFSADVLILNGSTGQRCRRPKSDFWDEKASEILFRFPTDEEFNKYLLKNCGFAIPKLDLTPNENLSTDDQQLSEEIWSRCENDDDLEDCIESEIEILDDGIRDQIKQKLMRRLADNKEKNVTQLQNDLDAIRLGLVNNTRWPSIGQNTSLANRCQVQAKNLLKESTKKLTTDLIITQKLKQICEDVVESFEASAQKEVESLRAEFLGDFSWTKSFDPKVSKADCQAQYASKLKSKDYENIPEIYTDDITHICQKIVESEEYKKRASDAKVSVTEKKLESVKDDLSQRITELAKSCVQKFPIDTQMNRVKYKEQRESCLYDNWITTEESVLNKAKSDPDIKHLNISFEQLEAELNQTRRARQIKAIKDYFTKPVP